MPLIRVPGDTARPKRKRTVAKRKLPPAPTEESEQLRLAAWLDERRVCWTHVPNGGARHPATAVKLKAAGVKPGIPDILIFDRPSKFEYYVGVAIELKRCRGGKVSAEQQRWCDALRMRGWRALIAHGANDAIRELELLGIGDAGGK